MQKFINIFFDFFASIKDLFSSKGFWRSPFGITLGGLFLLSLLARILFLSDQSLIRNDETYYADWSRHWLITTPDHPAGLAYLVKLFHHFPSLPHLSYTLGVFIAMLVLSMVGAMLMRRVAFDIFAGKEKVQLAPLEEVSHPNSMVAKTKQAEANAKLTKAKAQLAKAKAQLAGLLFFFGIHLLPYYAAISVISTTDTPLTVFSFFALFAYYTAFFIYPKKTSVWVMAGTLLALTLFSKLSAVFLIAGIGVYALLSKNRLQYLKTKGLYLSTLPVIAMVAVLLIDDYRHEFKMITYTLARANRPLNLVEKWDTPLGVIFSQFTFYSPLIIFVIGWALPKAILSYLRSPRGHSSLLPPSVDSTASSKESSSASQVATLSSNEETPADDNGKPPLASGIKERIAVPRKDLSTPPPIFTASIKSFEQPAHESASESAFWKNERVFFFASVALFPLVYGIYKIFTNFVGTYWISFVYPPLIILSILAICHQLVKVGNVKGDRGFFAKATSLNSSSLNSSRNYDSNSSEKPSKNLSPNKTPEVSSVNHATVKKVSTQESQTQKTQASGRGSLILRAITQRWIAINFMLATAYICFVPLHVLYGVTDPDFHEPDPPLYRRLTNSLALFFKDNFGQVPIDNSVVYHLGKVLVNEFPKFYQTSMDPSIPIISSHYAVASLMNQTMNLDKFVPALSVELLRFDRNEARKEGLALQTNYYSYVFDFQTVKNKDVYFIANGTNEENSRSILSYLEKYCEEAHLLKVFVAKNHELPIYYYYLYYIKGERFLR